MIDKLKKYVKNIFFRKLWNWRGHFPYYNQQVYFPKNSIIFHRAITDGIYERENVHLINKLINENTTVLDVGANIGLMALPILSSYQNINVISIEPSPNSYPFLEKTKTKSIYNNRWTLINKAVSNKVGKINFQLAAPNNAAYESMLNTTRINFVNSIEIECTTIDTIWQSIGKPEISFIKIDIEGADLLALNGAIECMNKCKPTILMEWNQTNIVPYNFSNTDFLNFVNQVNYSIYALPSFSKCDSKSQLNLFCRLDENFLLISNE